MPCLRTPDGLCPALLLTALAIFVAQYRSILFLERYFILAECGANHHSITVDIHDGDQVPRQYRAATSCRGSNKSHHNCNNQYSRSNGSGDVYSSRGVEEAPGDLPLKRSNGDTKHAFPMPSTPQNRRLPAEFDGVKVSAESIFATLKRRQTQEILVSPERDTYVKGFETDGYVLNKNGSVEAYRPWSSNVVVPLEISSERPVRLLLRAIVDLSSIHPNDDNRSLETRRLSQQRGHAVKTDHTLVEGSGFELIDIGAFKANNHSTLDMVSQNTRHPIAASDTVPGRYQWLMQPESEKLRAGADEVLSSSVDLISRVDGQHSSCLSSLVRNSPHVSRTHLRVAREPSTVSPYYPCRLISYMNQWYPLVRSKRSRRSSAAAGIKEIKSTSFSLTASSYWPVQPDSSPLGLSPISYNKYADSLTPVHVSSFPEPRELMPSVPSQADAFLNLFLKTIDTPKANSLLSKVRRFVDLALISDTDYALPSSSTVIQTNEFIPSTANLMLPTSQANSGTDGSEPSPHRHSQSVRVVSIQSLGSPVDASGNIVYYNNKVLVGWRCPAEETAEDSFSAVPPSVGKSAFHTHHERRRRRLQEHITNFLGDDSKYSVKPIYVKPQVAPMESQPSVVQSQQRGNRSDELSYSRPDTGRDVDDDPIPLLDVPPSGSIPRGGKSQRQEAKSGLSVDPLRSSTRIGVLAIRPSTVPIGAMLTGSALNRGAGGAGTWKTTGTENLHVGKASARFEGISLRGRRVPGERSKEGRTSGIRTSNTLNGIVVGGGKILQPRHTVRHESVDSNPALPIRQFGAPLSQIVKGQDSYIKGLGGVISEDQEHREMPNESPVLSNQIATNSSAFFSGPGGDLPLTGTFNLSDSQSPVDPALPIPPSLPFSLPYSKTDKRGSPPVATRPYSQLCGIDLVELKLPPFLNEGMSQSSVEGSKAESVHGDINDTSVMESFMQQFSQHHFGRDILFLSPDAPIHLERSAQLNSNETSTAVIDKLSSPNGPAVTQWDSPPEERFLQSEAELPNDPLFSFQWALSPHRSSGGHSQSQASYVASSPADSNGYPAGSSDIYSTTASNVIPTSQSGSGSDSSVSNRTSSNLAIDVLSAWNLLRPTSRFEDHKAAAVDSDAFFIGSGVKETIPVAIIDTGVNYLHPDLQGSMWVNSVELHGTPGVDDDGNGFVDDVYGWNFYHSNNNPMDDNGHGSHVSGIVGATPNNNVGISGISPQAKLMALKILDANGEGDVSQAIPAIQYALDNNAKVITNSWGGIPGTGGAKILEALLHEVVRDSADSVFVIAAGNDGINITDTPYYPASFLADNTVTVGAYNGDGTIPEWANFGGRNVHLTAPGQNITSTWTGSNYRISSGTSMAAPMVSGVAALVMSANPFLKPQQVVDILVQTVSVDAKHEGISITGGRLNAWRAVMVAPLYFLSLNKSVSNLGEDDGTLIRAGVWKDVVEVNLNCGVLPTGTFKGMIEVVWIGGQTVSGGWDERTMKKIEIPVTLVVVD
eukprot:GHVQ01002454.1.p1 GENE.GHVQ01002454.1~~GHVQ01002454.1.p1  ORF type:complete len:1501 (+),score=177.87 GHVQ01002454.1:109-4611(+)